MIESILEIDQHIIYSCYIKKDKSFTQNLKEKSYISLLSKIVYSIGENISIIFDTFNKQDFENSIIEHISSYKNVQAIMSMDSQKEAGLQLVDNICSIIRLHLSNMDEYEFYEMIEQWVQEV